MKEQGSTAASGESARDFFVRYRDAFNKALSQSASDLGETASLFAGCFVGADPSGVRCGKNDDTFLDAMLKGYAFYRNIGITSMEIISTETTRLDNLHTMVRVCWRSNYEGKKKKGSIEFTNIYFLQLNENRQKVFAYITGDEQAALKKCGLLE